MTPTINLLNTLTYEFEEVECKPYTDFTKYELDDVEFPRYCDLSYSDFSLKNLRHTYFNGANLSNCNFHFAHIQYAIFKHCNLTGARGLPIVDDYQERLVNVANAALYPEALDMSCWHTCDTTHCIAGWAIHQAGSLGKLLESDYGAANAGLILLGTEAHGYFWKCEENDKEEVENWLTKISLDARIKQEENGLMTV